MKHKIILSTSLLLSTLFFACSGEPPKFDGCWRGEAGMIFEVINDGMNNYTIRNINGDLMANVVGDTLRGKNALDMEYKMTVKGDSAYYEFGSIVTGYQRISQEEYNKLFEAQKAPVEEPAPAEPTLPAEAPVTEVPAVQ